MSGKHLHTNIEKTELTVDVNINEIPTSVFEYKRILHSFHDKSRNILSVKASILDAAAAAANAVADEEDTPIPTSPRPMQISLALYANRIPITNFVYLKKDRPVDILNFPYIPLQNSVPNVYIVAHITHSGSLSTTECKEEDERGVSDTINDPPFRIHFQITTGEYKNMPEQLVISCPNTDCDLIYRQGNLYTMKSTSAY